MEMTVIKIHEFRGHFANRLEYMLDLAAFVQPAQIIDKTSKHYKTRHTVSKIKNEVFRNLEFLQCVLIN